MILADQGYRTHQNPTPQEVAAARAATGDVGKASAKPDYLLEGKIFDCYSPGPTKPVRGVWSEVEDKVVDQQTQRIVINLQDWSGDLGALRNQFATWPIAGLKEVKVITDTSGTHQVLQLPHA